MTIFYILGLAFALSMDAFAVSVVNGFIISRLRFRHAVRIAFSFGIFQAVMPVIGWQAGFYFKSYIEIYDHWIVFFLLAGVGGKMIYESIRVKESLDKCELDKKNCMQFSTLILLSVATSIDALAVGLSFSLLEVNILYPVIIIGAVTFVVCLAGIYLGAKIGHVFEDKLETAGGIILILIGLKVLVSHLSAC